MGRKIDLTGKVFGKLTVVKEHPERTPQGSVQWVCQCECGNSTIVSGDNLRRNHTLSCGCLQKESAQARVINLIGQRFGKLTVIERADTINRQLYWWCQCDCGKIIRVCGNSLKQGKTKTCGCVPSKKPNDLTNQRFGKLTALELFYKNNKVYWHCQCDCGKFTDVSAAHLSGGKIQSCGCITYSIGEKNIENLLIENSIQYVKEYKFKDLGEYRYDFYLPTLNRLIEFDGKQHFQECGGSWDENDNLEQRQARDKIKNNYAISNNIDLVRIPYWKRDTITIEMLLEDEYLIKGE